VTTRSFGREGFLSFKRFATAISFSACALLAAWSVAAPARRQPTAQQINAIFSSVTSHAEPGLAVLVRKEGKTVFVRAYGMRDLRSRRPVTLRTDFRLASCSKQFTAMAIMLLVHDGKLKYSDRLTDIFPDFPTYGRSITVRNLLNHTSGLADYEELMDKEYAGKPREEIPQIHDADVFKLMEQQVETQFPPGSTWKYSNSGYCVLAMIVQKLSGMPFAEFLHRRIFAPLGMNETLAHQYGKDLVPQRAYGYTNDAGVWLETDQSATSATLGDGGVYSNIRDLAKWDQALRNHTLLSSAEMNPAITPVRLPLSAAQWPKGPDGAPVEYGFGWFLNPFRDNPRMWHIGDSIGFRTAIERFTRADLTVIILANRTDLDPRALALKVADLYFAN
jgi:CubicO group peptidase (beta-lactamase class C family)